MANVTVNQKGQAQVLTQQKAQDWDIKLPLPRDRQLQWLVERMVRALLIGATTVPNFRVELAGIELDTDAQSIVVSGYPGLRMLAEGIDEEFLKFDAPSWEALADDIWWREVSTQANGAPLQQLARYIGFYTHWHRPEAWHRVFLGLVEEKLAGEQRQLAKLEERRNRLAVCQRTLATARRTLHSGEG